MTTTDKLKPIVPNNVNQNYIPEDAKDGRLEGYVPPSNFHGDTLDEDKTLLDIKQSYDSNSQILTETRPPVVDIPEPDPKVVKESEKLAFNPDQSFFDNDDKKNDEKAK